METGNNVTSLVNDPDTSETLSFVLSGIPEGIIPYSTNFSNEVLFLGGDKYQVSSNAIETLFIPLPLHKSGNETELFPDLEITTVAQELEGDQASSDPWLIEIQVQPVADPFASWNPGQRINETDLDEGATLGIFLGNNLAPQLTDTDSSEMIVNYTFDFANFITNADVEGVAGGTSFSDLLPFIEGDYVVSGTTITVDADNIGGLYLRAGLFFDSNVDFSIGVSAWLVDGAWIGGTYHTDYRQVTGGNYDVEILGQPDTPTVFGGGPYSGESGYAIAIDTIGGTTTDTDVALGRSQSESTIYYLVEATLNGFSSYAFADAMGNPRGLGGVGNSWLLFESDLPGLHVFFPNRQNGTADFEFTTVVIENDNSAEYGLNTTVFSVSAMARPGDGNNTEMPLVPIVGGATAIGTEDQATTLSMSIMADGSDMTNPVVSVEISDLPGGFTVRNAVFNPLRGVWIASEADVNAGIVEIVPPSPDQHLGDLDSSSAGAAWEFTVEGVASNTVLRSTTGPIPVELRLDPVADGVEFSVSTMSTNEDESFNFVINPTLIDGDSSEEFYGPYIYFSFNFPVTIIGPVGIQQVMAGDIDEFLDLVDMKGFYRLPFSQLSDLEILPVLDLHGPLEATIRAMSQELFDPTNINYQQLSTDTFTINVEAVADLPDITVPSTILTAAQTVAIDLAGEVNVESTDTNFAVSPETMFAVISGVPSGTLFTEGFNNGNAGSPDGSFSWSIPVGDLASLMIEPPTFFAGRMNLTLTGIAREANGDANENSDIFFLDFTPVADDLLTLAENVDLDDAVGVADLTLNVRLDDDTGSTYVGEIAPETVAITFGNVPEGIFFRSPTGGSFSAENGMGGDITFRGTEDQANLIELVATDAVMETTLRTIGMSSVTQDGTDVLASPFDDQFALTIGSATTGTVNTIDQFSGGVGVDLIRPDGMGGPLSGGGGTDIFVFSDLDVGSVTNISDFDGDDQLDVSQILASAGVFNRQLSDIADFVQLSSGTLSVRPDGTGSFDALVSGVGALGTIETAYANGSLVLGA